MRSEKRLNVISTGQRLTRVHFHPGTSSFLAECERPFMSSPPNQSPSPNPT